MEYGEYTLVTGQIPEQITAVEFDSRKLIPGSLFVAVKGFASDGHTFIKPALENGASVIVVDESDCPYSDDELEELAQPSSACVIKVKDSRRASAYLASSFFDEPQEKLHMIGITGTKGKTTISFMVRDILETAGHKSGLIGTVYDIVGGEKIHAAHTTPEARDNYELLKKMVDCGSDSCVMEVSSQGLKLDRVYGIEYEIGCFTNFYEDHIGGNEHPDMEDYLRCKLKMFEQSKIAVINMDTPVSAEVFVKAQLCGCQIITYGLSDGCDVQAYNLEHGMKDGRAGTYFDITCPWYNGRLFVAIPGKFNVYNALCAMSAAFLSGVKPDAVEASLARIEVPGRLQPVKNDLGITILVDYAHNAASLENVLDTLKETTDKKVITVFGCGGDRSHTRRFEMGEVAGNKSDFTIVTSDNPRTEDPSVIIGHIVSAIEKTPGEFITVQDRAEAIHKAIEIAAPGDIVLIAGKGHEDYQIFKDKTIHFDDAEVAAAAAAKIREERA